MRRELLAALDLCEGREGRHPKEPEKEKTSSSGRAKEISFSAARMFAVQKVPLNLTHTSA